MATKSEFHIINSITGLLQWAKGRGTTNACPVLKPPEKEEETCVTRLPILTLTDFQTIDILYFYLNDYHEGLSSHSRYIQQEHPALKRSKARFQL